MWLQYHIRFYIDGIPFMISVALSRIFFTNVQTLTTFPELRMIACTTFVLIGNLGFDIVKEVFRELCKSD